MTSATRVSNSPVGTLRALIACARPRQWPKNVLLYFPLVFSVNQRLDEFGRDQIFNDFIDVTLGFLIFCMLTSATYLINDTMDAEKDRHHPTKSSRPIASGRLSKPTAIGASVVLFTAGLALAFVLRPEFGVVAAAYVASTLAYSLYLKNIAILDAMLVASGFLLRAVAGAEIIGVTVSPWLYAGTSAGALLISFGKRRNELALMGNSAEHRPALAAYSHPQLMDQLMAVATSATLITYAMYTFLAPNLPANHAMMLTIPFVLYGIFRYLFLVYHRNMGGSPEEILLKDAPMLVNMALWLASAAAILLVFD